MKEADFEAETKISFPTLLLCVMAFFPLEMPLKLTFVFFQLQLFSPCNAP